MAKRSYRDLAEDDIRVAQKLYDCEEYTHAARLCQQYLEKMFKERIEQEQDSSNYTLMSTHNLSILAKKLIDEGALNVTDIEMLIIKTLKEYYFDLNYPNEANDVLTRDEVETALLVSQGIAEKIKWKETETKPITIFDKFSEEC